MTMSSIAGGVRFARGGETRALSTSPTHCAKSGARTGLRSLGVLVGTLLLGAAPAFAQTPYLSIPVKGLPTAIAVNPVTNKIYVARTGLSSDSVTIIRGADNSTNSIAIGSGLVAVAVNPVTNKVYVLRAGGASANKAYVIDDETVAVTPIAVGSGPVAIAVNPVTNKIYIANGLDGSVTEIDSANGNLATTIPLLGAPTPLRALAVNPVTNKIYVAGGTNTVVAIDAGSSNDPTTYSQKSVTTGGNTPRSVAVNPVTNKIYVANSGAVAGNWYVTVIDGSDDTTKVDVVTNTGTAGSNPWSVAVNPVTDTAWIAASAPTFGVVRIVGTGPAVGIDTGPETDVVVNPVTNQIFFGRDGGSSVFLAVVNGDTMGVSLKTLDTGTAQVSAVNPVTGKVYVATNTGSASTGSVNVLDCATNTPVTGSPVDVGLHSNPNHAVVNPVTHKAYTANSANGTVTRIDSFQSTKTITVGTNPLNLSVNSATNSIYVANGVAGTVSVIDGATDTLKVTPDIATGSQPNFVAVNAATNRMYVTNQGSDTVTVIDGRTNTKVPPDIVLAAGARPYGVDVNPVTNTIYVANFGNGTVSVIDGVTNALLTTLSLGAAHTPEIVAVNPVTNKIYVTNSSAISGKFYVTVIKGPDGVNPASVLHDVQVGSTPRSAVVNPLTNRIYVSNSFSASISIIDGAPGGQLNQDAVIATPGAGGSFPLVLGLNLATNKVYSPNRNSNIVGIVDGGSGKFVTIANAGTSPLSVAVDPTTGKVYVANLSSGSVTVFQEQPPHAVPLTTAITALPGDTTTNPAPAFTFTTSSAYSPAAPTPRTVAYQVDTWQGTWQLAGGVAPTFTGAIPAQTPGTHILYAYAGDGSDATSINAGSGNGTSSSPVSGQIAAYVFTIVTPPTHLAIASVNGGNHPFADAPFNVVVNAQDVYDHDAGVINDTTVTLSLASGSGILGGTLACTMAAGTDNCTVAGVRYDTAESGVVLTATRTSGDSLTTATSAPFIVDGAPPGPPSIGTATAGNAQAAVTFGAPPADGGSTVTSYTATSSPGNIIGSCIGAACSPIAVNGLVNGTAYTFTVTATNGVGTGLPSAPSNTVTPATIPDAPAIGAATAGNTQVTVAFSAPASDGGSAVSSYTARSSPGNITGSCIGAACSSITVNGLVNGTPYTFTVIATNAVGPSLPSAPSNSAIPGISPPTLQGAALRKAHGGAGTFNLPLSPGP